MRHFVLSVIPMECRADEVWENVWPFCDSEREGNPRADLASGLAIDPRAAQPEVDRDIVLDLPNCPD